MCHTLMVFLFQSKHIFNQLVSDLILAAIFNPVSSQHKRIPSLRVTITPSKIHFNNKNHGLIIAQQVHRQSKLIHEM